MCAAARAERRSGAHAQIVIATNIAETSITIDDVVYVVDAGRVKENRYDNLNRMAMLVECWVSRASAKQRRGRAGRVKPGVCYHLFSSARERALADYTLPEMLRVPLDETVLSIRCAGAGARTRRAADDPPRDPAGCSSSATCESSSAPR